MHTKVAQPYTVLKIATDNGPLAQIWLAANMPNISRSSILQTSVAESAKEIIKVSGCTPELSENNEFITLRTSGELLQGIVRVYSKQAGFLLSDIKDTLTKIGSLFNLRSRVHVTISKVNTIAKVDQLILEDTITEKEVLVTPSLDFLNESIITTTKKTEETNLLNEDDSMRRKVHGKAAAWDTSLEVGRRFNPDDNFEHNSSLLDLAFDINDGYPLDTSNEGTRNTPIHSINTTQMKNTLLDNNNNDFPLEEQSNNDWDLGINDKDNDRHDDIADRSIEVGRRAGEPVMDEHTDFGFDLDIDKNNFDDIHEEITSEPGKTKSFLKRPRRLDPALKNAIDIITDNEPELSKEELNKTNSYLINIETSKKINNLTITQKRLWSEILNDVGYLPLSVSANLLSYQELKKPKINKTIETVDDVSPLDISLQLGDNSIDNFDMIDDNFEDMGIQSPNDSDHDMAIETHGIEEFNEKTFNNENGREETTEKDNELEDNVRLNTGELVSTEIVKMAEALRVHTDATPIKYSELLSNKQETDEIPTKKEASRYFFDVLTLATAGCVELEQNESFDDISISTRSPLFEKFIPA